MLRRLRIREPPQLPSDALSAGSASDAEVARQHAPGIAIEDGVALPAGSARGWRPRSSGRSREARHLLEAARKLARELIADAQAARCRLRARA